MNNSSDIYIDLILNVFLLVALIFSLWVLWAKYISGAGI